MNVKLVVALGSAQVLSWGSTYYLPAILAEPQARELGVGTPWIFGALSVALAVAALLGPLAGRWIDLTGGRSVLATSSLVFAGGLSLLGAADSLALIFAAWLVIGAGMAMGLYEAAFSTLAAHLGASARSSITGITLIAGFASTLCWPLTAFLEVELGWRQTCFTWAAIHLAVGWPINRFAIPGRPKPRPASTAAQPASAKGFDPRMLLLAFVFAAAWFISTSLAAHLPRLLQMAGLSVVAAIAVGGLVGPAQVAARMLEFALLRRFHPLVSARIASLAHPLGAAALLALGSPVAAVFALLHGAGNGIMTIASGTLPLALFGASGYGFRQGMIMAPARFCQALAPLAFAFLLERYAQHALAVTAAIGCAGFLALLALKQNRPHG
ncbi:MAG TPA: MFS transporter [Burkholderiales bacterium]|nr:MFS transporter [Burkholderiales bacterium]